MAYITLNKAHTHHQTTINGQPTSQYSRYETGLITGSKRNLPAILADNTGSDGYGFDSAVGSDDDSWHVLNAFDRRGSYIDTIAVGGAMDSDHALVVAQTQLDSLGASSVALIGTGLTQFDSLNQSDAGTFSIDAINKLMDNPSQDKSYLPIITTSELAYEADRVTFDSVQWGENSNELLSHDGRDSTLMLDMTRADTRSDLLNEFELADVLDLLGAEPEQSFDALMDTKNRLNLLKDRLYNAMSRAGNDTVSVTNVTETKPFKRQGVTNIAFVFDLSDGQKLSIWFHNPDSTPSKLMPSDIMISWKWMLNKRDVTAALSPKQGDNVQLPVLASRIMRVAAKNSMRFKRTQARKLKLEQDLLDAQALVDTKVATIEQLDKDIESLTSQIDAAMKAPKIEPVVEPVVEPVIETLVVDEAIAESSGQEIDADNLILELKGNELGEFEESSEGKKQLRAAAKDEFNKLRGQWIDCPSLSAAEGENAKIEIRKRGIKEFMAFSGDSRKLKLVAKIAEIIKTATFPTNGWQDNEKLDKKPMTLGYYHLENKVSIDGEIIELRVLIEKDQKGLLHYDVILPKHEASFDNLEQKNVLETAIPDNDSGVASSTLNIKAPNNEDVNQDQTMFDKADLATEGVVLNMFILNDTSTEDTASNDDIPDDQTNNITTGKTNTSSTVKGTEIKSRFALVEAKSLITSHDASGAVNPSFPQELQPRDRSNTKSVESIKENAKNLQPEKLGDTKFAGNGAPIVGDDLIVESGNGRVIAINTAYQNGSADNYKQWLTDNAQDFGFSSDQVQKYEQPVLVRVRVTDVDRIDFTVEANLDPDSSVKNTEDDNLGDQNTTPPQDEPDMIDPSGDTPVTPEPPTVDDTSSDVPVTTDNDLASRVDTIVDRIESSDFDAENFDVDALTAIADEAEGNSDLTAKLEAASEVYQNKLIAIAMQAMSDMVGN